MARVVMLTGGGPWGFTLSGGKDFGSHLQILKLTPGGKAMKSGIKEKEFITTINNDETEGMTHHEAQQKIRFTGQTLTLTLISDKPLRGAACVSSIPPQKEQPSPPTSRPKPPPAPVVAGTPPTNQSTTPSKPQSQPQRSVPVHQRPVVKKSVVSNEPPASGSRIVPDSGLYSGQESTIQSPAFKKITVESPSVLSPSSTYAPPPPADQMRNVTINDGNTRKTSQRPQPPSNAPSQFTTTTMKIQSTSGPKGQPPISRPAPPPIAKHPPPPSPSAPSSSMGNIPSFSTTPQSPGGKVVARQGVCEACHQPIRGAYASAMNKVWHPEHFVCFNCKSSLSNTTFVFEDDKIFCDGCYTTQMAQTCFKCKRPIVGPMVNAADHHYHNACFTCAKCFRDLANLGGFNMEANDLFCADCFGDAFGAVCNGCGQKIAGNDLWVEALEHTWHPQCFICGGCRRPLEGGRFFAKLGRPYCGDCC